MHPGKIVQERFLKKPPPPPPAFISYLNDEECWGGQNLGVSNAAPFTSIVVSMMMRPAW